MQAFPSIAYGLRCAGARAPSGLARRAYSTTGRALSASVNIGGQTNPQEIGDVGSAPTPRNRQGSQEIGDVGSAPTIKDRPAELLSYSLEGKKDWDSMMRAWRTEAFGIPLAQRSMPIPTVHKANQVLIRVKAASVNPIDVRMAEGYGDELLGAWQQLESNNWNPISLLQKCIPSQLRSQLPNNVKEWVGQDRRSASRLPLIGGRDCSGEVVEVGAQVGRYKRGDEVIAVIPSTWQGSHADYVLTSVDALAPKPKNVGHVEATSMAYTACTAWNALVTVARLNPQNANRNRVLIHGGSGGIGVTAIQLLKAWGVPKVVATCSAKNTSLVEGLGAVAVDYSSPHAREQILAEGPFEVILDCVDSDLSRWSDGIMDKWRNCVHVSLVSPLLRDTDRYGLPMGVATTAVKQLIRGLPHAPEGKWFSYSFFYPNTECLEQLSHLMEQGKMKAVVDTVYGFSQLPEAYDKVGRCHASGKSVIDFEKAESAVGP